MNSTRDLLEQLVKSIVDKPENVEIKEIPGEKVVIYEVKVDREDLGKIIGKQGRTAKAIRTILAAISLKRGKKVVVEIIE
ncbi:MAG: KH domain-containing protein [candidate division WOR-3 bacterium]|nr:KH domain-containing protein [candidate division WOR-3 bacterium]MCX7948348.1 KH domain-containing protein [candidate division WOR-3 bacterium]MDW8151249.1 KH domain-containing protein [candidate division WOR-3 bacterium]